MSILSVTKFSLVSSFIPRPSLGFLLGKEEELYEGRVVVGLQVTGPTEKHRDDKESEETPWRENWGGDPNKPEILGQ